MEYKSNMIRKLPILEYKMKRCTNNHEKSQEKHLKDWIKSSKDEENLWQPEKRYHLAQQNWSTRLKWSTKLFASWTTKTVVTN